MSSTCIKPSSPFFHPYKNYTTTSPKHTLSIIYEDPQTQENQQLSLINHPAFRGHSSSNNNNNHGSTPNEILNGPLILLSSLNGPQKVIMSVVRTTTDHFALVYRYGRNYYSAKGQSQVPLCCINLRGVTVRIENVGGGSVGETGIVGFTLRPKNLDFVPATTSLTFICPEPNDEHESESSELQKWIKALSSSSSATRSQDSPRERKSSMPSLEEEDEEGSSSEDED